MVKDLIQVFFGVMLCHRHTWFLEFLQTASAHYRGLKFKNIWSKQTLKCENTSKNCVNFFSNFYGKVGVIFWLLFHLIWKNYVLNWDFDMKSWIVDFFTRFTWEKTPQNNISSQNFSVENNYLFSNIDGRKLQHQQQQTCLPGSLHF